MLIDLKTQEIDLFITREVEDQIRFLCNKLPRQEWSGVLFYTQQGEALIAKDILLMNIGNSTYTSFEENPDIANHIAMNLEELKDAKMGLVHSHHDMSTFFSTTDLHTLNDEGLDRQNFLSLIVNNKGQYTAKYTKQLKVMCDQKTDTWVAYTDCNIEIENHKSSITEEFEDRYYDILNMNNLPQTNKVEEPNYYWDNSLCILQDFLQYTEGISLSDDCFNSMKEYTIEEYIKDLTSKGFYIDNPKLTINYKDIYKEYTFSDIDSFKSQIWDLQHDSTYSKNELVNFIYNIIYKQ